MSKRENRERLGALLERLEREHPEAHQQITSPACGFGFPPSHALEDENDDWWGEICTMVCESIVESEGWEDG